MENLQVGPEHNFTFDSFTRLSEVAGEIEILALQLKKSGDFLNLKNDLVQNLSLKALRIFKARRTSDKAANIEGFSASPALDCLLDIYINTATGQRVSVTSACIGTACPLTTALRWIQTLEAQNLIRRTPDPYDRRRTYLALTDRGTAVIEEAIESY